MTSTNKVRADMQEMALDTLFCPMNFTKDGKVTLVYDPRRDVRVSKEFLEKTVDKLFTYEKLLENKKLLSEHPIIGKMHGYSNIPVEQAWEILENSRQFFRGKATA